MILSTKNLIATSLALVLSSSALAGASLSSLLSGGTLNSNNGKLAFSEFQYNPVTNAPAASDIEIITLDNGLLFGSPTFTDSTTGIVNFDVAYKVEGVQSQIVSVAMDATGSTTDNGVAGVSKTVQDLDGLSVAQLNQYFGGVSTDIKNAAFNAVNGLVVLDEIYLLGDNGRAELEEFQQTFGTTDESDENKAFGTPSSVPSPTAALAGLALLGVVGMRRRRG